MFVNIFIYKFIFLFTFFCLSLYIYFTLFYFILFYFILLYFTLFYFTLLYFTLLYFTLLYFTLLYFTLFYFILFYFILFYFYFLNSFYNHVFHIRIFDLQNKQSPNQTRISSSSSLTNMFLVLFLMHAIILYKNGNYILNTRWSLEMAFCLYTQVIIIKRSPVHASICFNITKDLDVAPW